MTQSILVLVLVLTQSVLVLVLNQSILVLVLVLNQSVLVWSTGSLTSTSSFPPGPVVSVVMATERSQ